MGENDPKTCGSCGTVNPWMNESCRECGATLPLVGAPVVAPQTSREASEPAARAPSNRAGAGATDPPRRWNIRWILLGVLLYVGLSVLGQFAVERWIVSGDPDLKLAYEQLLDANAARHMTEEQQEAASQVILNNSSFLAVVVAIQILTPLLIGVLIGFFSRGILDAAASMGLAVIILLIGSGGGVVAALVAAPLSSGLGALGGLLGARVLRRFV